MATMGRTACVAAMLFTSMAALAADASTSLRIGSKRFTESYILAQVLAQTAAPHLDASRPR